MKKRKILTTLLLSTFLLSACSFTETKPKTTNTSTNTSISEKVEVTQPSTAPNSAPKTVPIVAEDNISIMTTLINLTDQVNAGDNRNYYFEAGKARIQDDSDLKNGQLDFKLDSYGRSSTARGKLTYHMFEQSKGKRQGVPLNPPYWPKNVKTEIHYSLTGRTYHGYLYNRSHSIADSLGGEATYTSKANFTTGTRPQNIGANQKGGMRYAEEMVENYWKEHVNTNEIVHYQVEPMYKNNEVIPRGSIIDIKSSDNILNKRIVVINDVEGMKINYETGTAEKLAK